MTVNWRRAFPAVLVLVASCSAPVMGVSGARLDAPTITQELVVAGLAADPVTSTAADDPNHLLARPDGYTSRTTFRIPGVTSDDADPAACDRGGCVEGWPDEASAQRRDDVLTDQGRRSALLAEYDYLRPDGLLLRVALAATPDQAKKIGDVFLALGG